MFRRAIDNFSASNGHRVVTEPTQQAFANLLHRRDRKRVVDININKSVIRFEVS
jgi:hypothetical protein